ncbi:retropepsin-like aspartic protease [Salaquimonas pukyongi]|uniref:retropepsin-like aspartic protease n=1 Tax=Salaquimonas pukyongi TaxID=2712698 RepID=UPI0013BE9378|nr:retropepsin-like aspartic protease [Salaquimonas pukyongi]
MKWWWFLGVLVLAGCTGKQTAVPLLFSTPAQVFLVEVSIAGQAGKDATVPLIFDTGAAVTILDETTLQALGLSPLSTETILLPNNVTHQITRYRLTNLRLGDCVLRDVDVYGSPALVQGVLGLDVLGPLLPMTVTSAVVVFGCSQ